MCTFKARRVTGASKPLSSKRQIALSLWKEAIAVSLTLPPPQDSSLRVYVR